MSHGMRAGTGRAGTSLIEAVIAIGLLAGAVVLLAALAALAVHTNARARERTLAALMAAEKLEALVNGVTALTPSPGDSLTTDVSGWVEFLDPEGSASARPERAVFVRRWRVTAVGGDPDLLALGVEVSPCRRRGTSPTCGDPDARVRLTTVRSRTVR
jgi:type II secretory pathway pseudopilin PulG